MRIGIAILRGGHAHRAAERIGRQEHAQLWIIEAGTQVNQPIFVVFLAGVAIAGVIGGAAFERVAIGIEGLRIGDVAVGVGHHAHTAEAVGVIVGAYVVRFLEDAGQTTPERTLEYQQSIQHNSLVLFNIQKALANPHSINHSS